jgi:hypothetical protein
MADTEDVLDNYLIWELCKQKDLQELILEGSKDGDSLKSEIVDKVKKDYREEGYRFEEKLELVRRVSSNPDHKMKMFKHCSWERETVKVSDLGTTLPNAMGLPPEVISGGLPQVLEFVRKAYPEDYQSIKYIEQLKKKHEVLNEFLPTAITPGRIIRRQDRMKNVHGDKNWDIEDKWGAVHDGNHRLAAKVLGQDLEEVMCYVGRPSSDKIYEHVEL